MKSVEVPMKMIRTWIPQVTKSLIIGAIILFAVIAPIIHAFQPTLDQQMVEVKKAKKKLVKELNHNSKAIFNDLKAGKITAEEYVIKYEKNKLIKSQKTKQFKKLRSDKLASLSYRGYDTFRYFLFSIGLTIFIFIVSLRYMYKVLKTHSKVYEKIEVLLFSCVSLFFVIWASKNTQDYNNQTYITTLVLESIVGVVIVYFLIYYYNTIEQKLKKGIKLLISYISSDLFDKIPEKDKKEVFIDNLKKYDELTKIVK